MSACLSNNFKINSSKYSLIKYINFSLELCIFFEILLIIGLIIQISFLLLPKVEKYQVLYSRLKPVIRSGRKACLSVTGDVGRSLPGRYRDTAQCGCIPDD